MLLVNFTQKFFFRNVNKEMFLGFEIATSIVHTNKTGNYKKKGKQDSCSVPSRTEKEIT